MTFILRMPITSNTYSDPLGFPCLLLEPGLPPVSKLQLSLLELRLGSPLCHCNDLCICSLFPGLKKHFKHIIKRLFQELLSSKEREYKNQAILYSLYPDLRIAAPPEVYSYSGSGFLWHQKYKSSKTKILHSANYFFGETGTGSTWTPTPQYYFKLI